MNYRYVIRQLGLLMLVLSGLLGALAFSSLVLLVFGADLSVDAAVALGISAAIGLALGGAPFFLTRGCVQQMGRREALLLVAMSWIFGAAVAATPFFLWAHAAGAEDQPFRNYVDCYFESMSGLTTTGATVLTDIEALPPLILLWRALTHWLGGLGIVVLFVAVLPSLGVGGKKLFRVEAPGPSHEGVRPHIGETARVLWFIYVGLTITAAAMLWALTPMGLFDSICHSFSMLSTGGLSTRNASIGAYDSAAADYICTLFMIIAGVNFALFYQMTQGKWRSISKDVELRVFLWLKLAVIVVVTLTLIGGAIAPTAAPPIEDASVGEALRYATFGTVALHTGTGFGTSDTDLFPYVSVALLIGLMFVGGCAGSTAGGVKVVRVWIAIKVMAAELEKAYRPNVVRPIRMGGTTLEPEQALACVVYVLGFAFAGGIGAFLIQVLEHDPRCGYLEAFTGSLSTLANVGPGLGELGATKNYGWLSDGPKIVMTILMALGRLEFFALLVLFTPRFWRGH